MSKINNVYLWSSIVALLMIPYSYYAFVSLSGFSVAFWIATSVYMLIAVAYSYYNSRDLTDPHLMRENLVKVRTKVALAKKRDNQWLLIGIPILFLWIGWFAYEVYQKGGQHEMMTFAFGGTIGGIIGLIIGLNIHFKTQRQYREIIEQIEDVTKG